MKIELIPTDSLEEMQNDLLIVDVIGGDPVENAAEDDRFVSIFDRFIGQNLSDRRVRQLEEMLHRNALTEILREKKMRLVKGFLQGEASREFEDAKNVPFVESRKKLFGNVEDFADVQFFGALKNFVHVAKGQRQFSAVQKGQNQLKTFVRRVTQMRSRDEIRSTFAKKISFRE